MVRKIAYSILMLIISVLASVPSFAEEAEKEKEYKIVVPTVPYSEEACFPEGLYGGNSRCVWGVELGYVLACRDTDPDRSPLERNNYLWDDWYKVIETDWEAVLPDGSVVKPYRVKDGSAIFATPYEMIGIMKVRASVGGAVVAEFEVTVAGLLPSGEPFRGWDWCFHKRFYILNSGKLARGWKKISGKWYFFKKDGAMALREYHNGYWLSSNGSWTYKYKASWHKSSKGWWYGDSSGWYAKNQTLTINGVLYTFDVNGYLVAQ